jgi:hypothetical protein
MLHHKLLKSIIYATPVTCGSARVLRRAPPHNDAGKFVPVVERLSISNGAPTIDADDVRRQVLEGVFEANA